MGSGRRKHSPARTEEAREQQLISLAIDLAEKQLIEGTASSQTIQHYLKLGSSREKLEQARLRGDNALIDAKIEAMASAQRVEELYGAALKAMSVYTGQASDETDGEEYDDYDYHEDVHRA
jgi:hypothetical protein